MTQGTHMTLQNCRAPATLLLSLMALSGCGGVANDIADAFGDAFECGLNNCTESSTLGVDEISPKFTATQSDAGRTITVEGSLGKSANVFTIVTPASNETLSASADGGPEVRMSNPDGKRYAYTASLSSTNAQPVVRVVFTRAGQRHINEVTMPAAFTVLQPTGNPLLRRNGAALSVRLSLASTANLNGSLTGSCTRADNSSFELKDASFLPYYEPSVAGGLRLEPDRMDAVLNEKSRAANKDNPNTSAVSLCQLTVTWTKTAQGSIAPTMNQHGLLTAQRQATHPLSYDARP